MDNLLFEPLKFYDSYGKGEHDKNVKEFFDKLVEKSEIDVAENRKTAAAYRKQDAHAEKINKKISKLKVLRGFLIFFTVLAFLIALIGGFAINGTGKILCVAIGAITGIALILIIALKLNKSIKNIAELYKKEKAKADELYNKARLQMAPLNALFSETDTFELIHKTLPQLKFDDNYTVKLSKDFKTNYDFVEYINENRSVTNTLSGRLFENPFVFYRYIDHYMGTKTYHGSIVIRWQTVARGSDGKMRTVTKTQTLHASVTKPFPQYSRHTALGYGNQCAPDLNFSRAATDVEELNDKQVARRVKKGEKKLKKLTASAMDDGKQFTKMGNTEFDVLFGATDRDHEVQFRVMFSPLAQKNMIELLRSPIGYGDDFSFTKRGRFNYIVSEHAQKWNMDTSPSNYYSYDVDEAKSKFIGFNNDYFKSVFFDFAPLLTVPAYQQEPSEIFEPIKGYTSNYSYYDYEVMANSIGVSNFAHPESVTEVILKARHMFTDKETDCVQVTAQSYAAVARTDFIPVFGGDGRMHSVPVPWTEYIPVEKSTNMAVKRIGCKRQEFIDRAAKSGSGNSIYDTPSAYFHGLFAKIIDGADIKAFDSALDNLKKN